MANALKKRHVGHFCPPGEHGRVETLLDIGRPCDFGTPRKLDQWFLRYSNFIFRRRRVMAYQHLAYPMGTPHLAYPGPSGTCI